MAKAFFKHADWCDNSGLHYTHTGCRLCRLCLGMDGFSRSRSADACPWLACCRYPLQLAPDTASQISTMKIGMESGSSGCMDGQDRLSDSRMRDLSCYEITWCGLPRESLKICQGRRRQRTFPDFRKNHTLPLSFPALASFATLPVSFGHGISVGGSGCS